MRAGSSLVNPAPRRVPAVARSGRCRREAGVSASGSYTADVTA
jgi:hypothetical protein